jgi:hypothetical protein
VSFMILFEKTVNGTGLLNIVEFLKNANRKFCMKGFWNITIRVSNLSLFVMQATVGCLKFYVIL